MVAIIGLSDLGGTPEHKEHEGESYYLHAPASSKVRAARICANWRAVARRCHFHGYTRAWAVQHRSSTMHTDTHML